MSCCACIQGDVKLCLKTGLLFPFHFHFPFASRFEATHQSHRSLKTSILAKPGGTIQHTRTDSLPMSLTASSRNLLGS